MADETKETPRDSLETETSEGQEGTTLKKPDTFTADQVAKLLSDTKAASGRDLARVKQEADSYKRQLGQHTTELTELQTQLDRAEDKRAEGDTETLDVLRLRRDTREAQRAVARDKQALEDSWLEKVGKVEEAEGALNDLKLLKIAGEHELGAAQLELLKKLSGSSDEDLEMAAKILAQSKPKVMEEFKPDSGITIGGGKPTAEQLEAMTPEQYAAYWKKRQAE